MCEKPITAERIERGLAVPAHIHARFPYEVDFMLLDTLEAALDEINRQAGKDDENRFKKYLTGQTGQKAARSASRPVA